MSLVLRRILSLQKNQSPLLTLMQIMIIVFTENLISSPNREQDIVLPAFSVSTLNDCSSDSSSDLDPISQNQQNCVCTLYNFTICVNEIISGHGTSDAQASDWLTLMKTAFPENKIPCFKSIKGKHLKRLSMVSEGIEVCGFGECATLDFLPDLCYVIKNNIAAISDYCATSDPRKDVVIPPTFGERNVMTISLAMNSDGVRIVNSKNRSLWPLWFSILNLPPILRCKFAYIVLAKLWFGRGKPNWQISFDQVKEELDESVSIEYNNIMWTLKFDTKFLVADLPAKALILNMQQLNAYFGCSICLIVCKAIGDGNRGLYYPNQRHKLRTKSRHESYIDLIQIEGLETFRGVKGPSAVSHIIDNIPLAAPIDYMHQVLLGVTRSLLFSVRNQTKKSDLEKINSAVGTIQLTSNFKRSLRSIEELEYFKANELKLWLLYIGPVGLRKKICDNLFERFHLLSYAIRLLLCSNEHSVLADQLIKRFQLCTVEAFSEKVFSSNIHALNHLTWQVGCFGPLWCTSAMMFESANYLLKCKFTGTVNHLKLLVERYARSKMSSQEVPRADRLQDLCFSLRKIKTFKRRCVSLHEAPADLQHLEAIFYSNQKFEYFNLDSRLHN